MTRKRPRSIPLSPLMRSKRPLRVSVAHPVAVVVDEHPRGVHRDGNPHERPVARPLPLIPAEVEPSAGLLDAGRIAKMRAASPAQDPAPVDQHAVAGKGGRPAEGVGDGETFRRDPRRREPRPPSRGRTPGASMHRSSRKPPRPKDWSPVEPPKSRRELCRRASVGERSRHGREARRRLRRRCLVSVVAAGGERQDEGRAAECRTRLQAQ